MTPSVMPSAGCNAANCSTGPSGDHDARSGDTHAETLWSGLKPHAPTVELAQPLAPAGSLQSPYEAANW
jgi:hypothetical protein